MVNFEGCRQCEGAGWARSQGGRALATKGDCSGSSPRPPGPAQRQTSPLLSPARLRTAGRGGGSGKLRPVCLAIRSRSTCRQQSGGRTRQLATSLPLCATLQPLPPALSSRAAAAAAPCTQRAPSMLPLWCNCNSSIYCNCSSWAHVVLAGPADARLAVVSRLCGWQGRHELKQVAQRLQASAARGRHACSHDALTGHAQLCSAWGSWLGGAAAPPPHHHSSCSSPQAGRQAPRPPTRDGCVVVVGSDVWQVALAVHVGPRPEPKVGAAVDLPRVGQGGRGGRRCEGCPAVKQNKRTATEAPHASSWAWAPPAVAPATAASWLLRAPSPPGGPFHGPFIHATRHVEGEGGGGVGPLQQHLGVLGQHLCRVAGRGQVRCIQGSTTA